MKLPNMPRGRTQVSDAVVDKIVMTAAREVKGVLDIAGLARGALVGVGVGGAVGLISGGMAGAAVGASAGSLLGATAAHLLARSHQRQRFHEGAREIPSIELRLSAEYGADLQEVAEEVRRRVRESIRDLTGLEIGQIEVIFTEVVRPAARARRPPSPGRP